MTFSSISDNMEKEKFQKYWLYILLCYNPFESKLFRKCTKVDRVIFFSS